MASKKTFINPLTRSSEEELHIPKPSQDASTENQPLSPTPHDFLPVRKRGGQAFEKTHIRFTAWVNKQLKQQFEKLVEEKGVSKTSLVNEAFADLLHKYMQK